MNFDDYRLRDRVKYTAFVGRICDILTSAAKARSIAPYSITGRAKDPDSLQRKLANRGLNPQEAIEAEIKDLAGC